MALYIVANLTDGPKVLNARPIIVLQAGESTDQPVEITDDEATTAAVSEWFKLDPVKNAKSKTTE